MKKILTRLIITFGLILLSTTNAFAIKIKVPPANWQDDVIISGTTTIETNENTLIDLIWIINNYLWFSLAGISMFIFVYAGIKLIIWWWKDKISNANKMLLGSGIAIMISMLSYALVRIIINLF